MTREQQRDWPGRAMLQIKERLVNRTFWDNVVGGVITGVADPGNDAETRGCGRLGRIVPG